MPGVSGDAEGMMPLTTWYFVVGLLLVAMALAEDHDLSRGGFRGLGLLVMAFSPLLAARLRSRTTGRGIVRRRPYNDAHEQRVDDP
jgi:hypothetical protein